MPIADSIVNFFISFFLIHHGKRSIINRRNNGSNVIGAIVFP